jgi:hypothetical protein
MGLGDFEEPFDLATRCRCDQVEVGPEEVVDVDGIAFALSNELLSVDGCDVLSDFEQLWNVGPHTRIRQRLQRTKHVGRHGSSGVENCRTFPRP